MTVKGLYERLRLLEPHERIAITSGEVRALMNYVMALVVEDMAVKAQEKVMEYQRVGLQGTTVPDFLATHSVLDYIHNHPYYGAAKQYGEWPCTMELDE